jgi:hypothetical protein
MSNGYPAHNFLRPDNFNGFVGFAEIDGSLIFGYERTYCPPFRVSRR